MKRLQKITQEVFVLLVDILMFTWQIVRGVILPTRSRKGNVLSNLLTFFVGLMERIVSFEKRILRQPVVFTHKYVRQGLIIAIGFLFLLSSFEWTIGPSRCAAGNGPTEVVACTPMIKAAQTFKERRANAPIIVPMGGMVAASSFTFNLTMPPATCRRWLRFGVFLI